MFGSAPFATSPVPSPMVNSRPPSSRVMVATFSCAVGAFSTTLVCSTAAFVASQIAVNSVANYSLCFCWASILVASICFCTTVLLHSTIFGARHCGGHELSMVKRVSSIMIKGFSDQFCAESLRALIYILCIFTLKSAKLHGLLYTVGDRCSLLLVHIRTLASMSTQKILVSRLCVASFVAQSDAYLVASGKSYSI